MSQVPIFTICRKAFPGANRALINLSQTTQLTRHMALASTNPNSPEIQFLVLHLAETRPQHVLFGGWDPAYDIIIRALRGKSIRFGVYWTSSGGQTDMSQEMSKLSAILRHEAIDAYLFCSEGVARGLQTAVSNTHYLPLTIADLPPETPTNSAHAPFAISLFCPPPEYKRKNIFNCLLALARLRGDYRLILNGLSTDPAYRHLLENLKIPFVDHGWMTRADYEAQLGQLDLGLQLSFAESFNYVAAEHLVRGVPVLASNMVPVVQQLSPQIQQQLTVAHADDATAVLNHLQPLIDNPVHTARLGQQARAELLVSNQQQIKAATAVLQSLL
ncbi:MAG: hypothetical protein AAF614_20015 [Chloroflexota bacterium]